ncbi:hypothetical protein PR002_g31752, partial [Phytophthora rubi]
MARQPTPMYKAALRWLNAFDEALQAGTLEDFTGVVLDNTVQNTITSKVPDVDKSASCEVAEGGLDPNQSKKIKSGSPAKPIVVSVDTAEWEEKAPIPSSKSENAAEVPTYKFTKPVKNKKLSRKASNKIARAQRMMGVRTLAKLCESSPPCAGSATVLNDILTGGYSYDTAVQAMKKFNVQVCEVKGDPVIRPLQNEKQLTLDELTKVVPLDR